MLLIKMIGLHTSVRHSVALFAAYVAVLTYHVHRVPLEEPQQQQQPRPSPVSQTNTSGGITGKEKPAIEEPQGSGSYVQKFNGDGSPADTDEGYLGRSASQLGGGMDPGADEGLPVEGPTALLRLYAVLTSATLHVISWALTSAYWLLHLLR